MIGCAAHMTAAAAPASAAAALAAAYDEKVTVLSMTSSKSIDVASSASVHMQGSETRH